MSLMSPPESLRGATRPRVEVAPGYVDTFGPEAADLMARAGKPLDEWQRDSVLLLLSTRDNGRWACVEYCELVARQNGKGGVLEARVLAGFLLLGERRIMWSAHEVKTSYDAFLRIQELLQALDRRSEEEKAADPNFILVDDAIPIKVVNTNGREGFVRLDTKQRIRFIARSKSSGRGMTGDLNVIDETFAYTAEQHAALFPTMMARPNPQIIYTSTPPLDAESGEILHNLRKRAEAIIKSLAESGHDGGDSLLAFRDWGLAGDLDNLDKIDVDDERLWAQPNPSLGGQRMTLEIVRVARRSMPLVEFARECLGIWPRARDNAGTIDTRGWAQLLDPLSRRVGDVALAVDITPDRGHAVISMFGLRADGFEHVQLLDYRPGTEWVIGRIKQLRDVLKPLGFGMGRGTAASLETDLAAEDVGITRPEDPAKPKRGDLFVLDYVEMSAAAAGLIDAVKQTRIRHLGQVQADKAVAGAKVRQGEDSVSWSRKRAEAGVNISPVVTHSVARYVHHTWSPIVEDDDYDPLDSIA